MARALLAGFVVDGSVAVPELLVVESFQAVHQLVSTVTAEVPGDPLAAVRSLFPGTIVAPGLMIGATDSRYFAAISDHVYRFSPVRARPEDLPRFHGTNERVSIANYAEMIQFYRQLLINASGPIGPSPAL